MSAHLSVSAHRFRIDHSKPFSHEELRQVCSYVNGYLSNLPFVPPSGALVELFLVEEGLVPAEDIPCLCRGRKLSPLSSGQALIYALHHGEEWVRDTKVVVCHTVELPLSDDLGARAIVCEMDGRHKRIFLPPSLLRIEGPVWVAGVVV